MKLIIQIPCFNEENTLPLTIKDLPKKIEGISEIEFLVIDDGSTDNTIGVARQHGVHHIIKNGSNKGLAFTFKKGVDECIKLGADIIVNTDADNQYSGFDIPKLIKPIFENKADIVIGSRPIIAHQEFSTLKKILQIFGSFVVRIVSKTSVEDAPSGFRAYTKDAANKINVFSSYTYTLETLIQAGQSGMRVVSVPINVNPKLRESRLFKGIFQYVRRSIFTIIRIFSLYKPFRFFGLIGIFLLLIGLAPIARFLIYKIYGYDGELLQSLIIGSVFCIVGFNTILFAFIADLISVNRRLLEQVKDKIKL